MPRPSSSEPSGRGWLAWAGRLAGAAVAGGLLYAIWRYWDHEAAMRWKEQAGPAPFFLALAILPAFGVPTTPFYIMAGATFGIAGGLAGSSLALAGNLALCYWISTGALRPWLERLLARTRHDLPEFSGKDAWRFTVLVKMTPGVPSFAKNYLLGLAGVPFGIYFWLSMVIAGLYAALFVVLGESAHERDFRKAGAAAAALALSAALAWWLSRRKAKRLE